MQITIPQIQRVTAEYYGFSVRELLRRSRDIAHVRPRQIAMYLCRKLTEASYPMIGEMFGGRDHTVVMYAEKQIKRKVLTDPHLLLDVEAITRRMTREKLSLGTAGDVVAAIDRARQEVMDLLSTLEKIEKDLVDALTGRAAPDSEGPPRKRNGDSEHELNPTMSKVVDGV